MKLAAVLARHGLLTAIHKHYQPAQWKDFLAQQPASIVEHIMVSTGTSDQDMEQLRSIMKQHPQLKFICIDVANGYAEAFVDFVRRCRDTFPGKPLLPAMLSPAKWSKS